MQAIPRDSKCCTDDVCVPPAQIPGPKGDTGANGTNGVNGLNIFTDTTSAFVQPAVSANVTIPVADSRGFSVGQPIFVETAGTYKLISKPDATHLQIQNLGYDDNAAPTTTIASGVHVSPTGFKGADGATSGGDMLGSHNLSDVADVPTSRMNLGLGSAALKDAGILNGETPTVDNGGGLTAGLVVVATINGLNTADAPTARGAIGAAKAGAVTGNNNTVSGTDKVLGRQSAGSGAIEEIPFTGAARTLAAAADVVAQRVALGKVLPRYGLLASKSGVDLNSAGSDNAMTVESSRYRIDKVTVENASVSLTTATAGLFSASGGGGATLAADQVLSALTAASKFKDLTLDAGVGTDVRTDVTIYFRVGTAQGAPATATVWVFGWRFD